MQQIWDLLRSQPILIIFVIGWLLSMVGGVVSRAAKQAQQRELDERRKRGEAARRIREEREADGGGRRAEASEAPQAVQQPAPMSPEAAVAEIRRRMGLAPAPKPAQPAAPVEVETAHVATRRLEPVFDDDSNTRSHGGNLAEELAEKERQRVERTKTSFERRAEASAKADAARRAKFGSGVSDRAMGRLPAFHSDLETGDGPVQGRRSRDRARRAASRVDGKPSLALGQDARDLFASPDALRAAFIAREVLGEPRAVREWS